MTEWQEDPKRTEICVLEAVLFAAGNPLTIKEIAAVLQLDILGTQNLLVKLQDELDHRHSGLTIRQVAGGYQLATRPELFSIVKRLGQVVDRKISAPTMETLSIIAFKQPVTKTEIEQIRGVRAERSLQKLLELDLIREVGRKAVIGRPILYGTTDTFLQCFGMNTLDDLPDLPTTEQAAAALNAEQMELFQEIRQREGENYDPQNEDQKEHGETTK